MTSHYSSPYGPIRSLHPDVGGRRHRPGYFGYHPLAGWWARVGAGLVDYGVPLLFLLLVQTVGEYVALGILSWLNIQYVGGHFARETYLRLYGITDSIYSGYSKVIIALVVGVVLFNSGWLAGTTGRSVGKRLTRLYLGSFHGRGEPPGAFRGIVRALLEILSLSFPLLMFIWVVWSPFKQTWGDIITSTVVVRQTWQGDRPDHWPIF